MQANNDTSEPAALVNLRKVQSQVRVRQATWPTSSDVREILWWTIWPVRLLCWPVRMAYRHLFLGTLGSVRRARAPRRGWSAGRERSSFLGRPGVTREARALKPADPELVQRQAELDELIDSARRLQLAACDRAERARTPATVAQKQIARGREAELEARRRFGAPVETQSDMVTPNEGPGSTPSAIDRVAAVVERQAQRLIYKPTGPTSDEARKATRLLQAERQRKTEAEDQAERDRHLLEGRAAQANEERQFAEYIVRYEAAHSKGKR